MNCEDLINSALEEFPGEIIFFSIVLSIVLGAVSEVWTIEMICREI